MQDHEPERSDSRTELVRQESSDGQVSPKVARAKTDPSKNSRPHKPRTPSRHRKRDRDPDPDPKREEILLKKRAADKDRKQWERELRTYDRRKKEEALRDLRSKIYALGEAHWRSKGMDILHPSNVRMVREWSVDPRHRALFGLPPRPVVVGDESS